MGSAIGINLSSCGCGTTGTGRISGLVENRSNTPKSDGEAASTKMIRSSAYKSTDPDPMNFKVMRTKRYGEYTMAHIRYPNCTNYEGNKVMVFYNIPIFTLKALTKLDPHFCEGDCTSPIARFEPTGRGWAMARLFCKSMRQAQWDLEAVEKG